MQSLKSLLRKDLELTRSRWSKALGALRARPVIDAALYDELESQLIEADVGVAATAELIERLKKAQRDKRLEDGAALADELKSALVALLTPLEQAFPAHPPKPFVILLAGVNGAGKTTTIAKLTRHFQSQGKSVLLAAGDTFRAAAREQLAEWGPAPPRDRGRAGPGRLGRGHLRRDAVGARERASTSCSPTPRDGCRRSCT
jgi:fused signal recognition particle receptor